MKKFFALFLSCIMCVSVLAGCGNKENSSSSVNSGASQELSGPIAIIIPSASHGWMAGISYFAEQKCKELNLDEGKGYKLMTSANVNEQANQIEEAISLNPSAIVLLPHTDEVSVTAQKISDKNIPLVVFDRKVEADYSAYIAGDNAGIGTKSAEYLGEKLGGKGTIAVLNVPSSGSVSVERVDAFKEKMSESYPDIKLIDMTASDFTQQSGLKTMTDVLTANEKIDAIFSIDDESSLGMLQAISDSKRTDIKYVTGAGGSQSYFAKIKENEQPLCMTATYSPSMIKDAVAAAYDLAQGKTVEKDNIITPSVVTKDNVSEFIDENSPY